MATENFLVNPPKRKPSRKHTKTAKRKIHRILALEGKSGGLFTSSQAKIVRKGIKINPFRRFRSNPLGEELMFVGLNPKKGGKTMRKRSKKRNYKKNPARRRYHRNPMSSVKSLIPMVLSGGVGALVGRAVPQFIPILNGMGTLGNIVSKVALAVGGAMLLDKTFGKKFKGIEDGWMIGSLASAAADLSSIGLVKTMQGFGMIAPYTGDSDGVAGIVDSGVSGIVDPYEMSGIDDPY